MAQPIVDSKIPLHWLIGALGAFVFALGANVYKLDALTTAVAKTETRSETRDDKVGLMAQTLVMLQSQTARNTEDIKELKALERARK